MQLARAQERAFDVCLAACGLVTMAPAMAAAAILIKLDDGGPVLFRQERCGRGRHPIVVHKLRTMQDGQVTRVGRWLRQSGLDEVPQFLDVLAGKMRVVGPRPLTSADVERLGWQGTAHGWRWQVAPGITGLAQLLGGRSARHSLALDRLYLRARTPALDLALVAASFVANVVGKPRVRRLLRARRRRSPHLPRPFGEPPPLDPTPPTRLARRHALLLNPFYAKDPHASFGKHVLTPSLALTSIAGATPPGWEVSYFDENLLHGPPPADPVPEVVGITVHLTFAERAYELARYYRARGAFVVLGGLHVLSCPDEARPHADALAIGDGVQLWPRILADLEAGTPRGEYRAGFDTPYRNDPPPARHLVPRKSFLTTTSLIATRGCHNRCGFCYLATDGLTMPYRVRDPEQIAAEWRATGEPYAVFIDNNLGSKKDYLRALCRTLRPLERIWSAAVTIDVTDDPSLVAEMALAGCTGVFVGFESLADENLAGAGKRTPRTADYARRVKILHDHGIQVNGSFVLGFDADDPSVFARTAAWIEDNRLECATFHVLTPYPGTPLFRQMEAEGRILHRDWRLYDTAHVVFRPKRMTVAELEEGYAWLYRRLFSHASIWRRRPADPSAVPPYLAMSYLYKRSNALWHLLIRHDLVHTVWSPLVELTRRRHVAYRRRLAAGRAGSFLSAGV